MNRLAGFLGGLALLAFSTAARADYVISVNGVACAGPTVSATPNITAVCGVVNVGSVTVQVLSMTGSQTGNVSEQEGSTLLIKNFGAATTLTIDLGISNFTAPTAPPSIQDSSGLTLNNQVGTNSATLVSCVETMNLLPPPVTTPFCAHPAPGQAPANPTITLTGPPVVTSSNQTMGIITTLGGPFALDQEIRVALGAGTATTPSSTIVTSSQILTAVPEPGSIVLLGGALVAIATIFRKKVKAARQS
jgi:hypothetical protein